MSKFFHIILIVVCFGLITYSQEVDHSQLKIECKSCHACNVPTKDDPCLIPCPRFTMIVEFPSSDVGPNVVLIDKLENLYLPVIFTHKLHAQMSEMTGGCIACHHYNTIGPILTCNECHETNRKRVDISKPDLTAAYHQQCLDCHRQWSHKTECLSCHAKRTGSETIKTADITPELMTKSHPEVQKPAKIVYQTNYEKGNIVTFFHDEHTSLFGLDCIQCHKNENCIRCHDLEKRATGKGNHFNLPVKVNVSKEERHQKCFGCHKEDDCSFCHKASEMKPFDHGFRTDWILNKYHIKLSCLNCHKKSTRFEKLDTKCISCHSDWNSKSFNHKITGLVFDDNHSDLACDDCHLEKDFEKKPSCTNCHDDKSYPANLPGRMNKK